jgi:hypothetical protein
VAGYFGNIEALERPLALKGFNFRPALNLPGFVEFGEATFRAGAGEAERPHHEVGLLGSLLRRPMVYRRNDIAWVAACAWRAGAKADDIAALKRAKRELDRRLIEGAAELVATLVRLAMVAEEERRAISERTKAALAAAKARGVRLGGRPESLKNTELGRQRAMEARRAKAAARAGDLAPVIEAIRAQGITSATGIAKALNERGIPTARGGKWQAVQVQRLLMA